MKRLLRLVGLPTCLFAASAVAAGPRPRIEVQGHRGARAVRPENTVVAFEYALKVGVDTLELDLGVTKDDHLVVAHDPFVSPILCATDDGVDPPEGLAIRSLTLAELRRYDCGSKKNPRFPSQVPAKARIPTLDEVLDHVAGSKHKAAKSVELNIETKITPLRNDLAPTPEAFARLVITALEKHRMVERAVIQSFDHRTLVAAKKLSPKIRVAMLTSDNFPDYVAVARSVGADIISPDHEWIDAASVEALHRARVRVIPWTANTPEAWARLIDLGVDGIITDDPASLIAYLGKRGLR